MSLGSAGGNWRASVKGLSPFLVAVVKAGLHFRWRFRVRPQKENHARTLVVLGTGPSLRHDLQWLPAGNPAVDYFCVSEFARTEHYDCLRPRYYLLLDPVYWRNPASAGRLERRHVLYEALNGKTTWSMKLFAPSYAPVIDVKSLVTNPEVQVVGYNGVGIPYANNPVYQWLIDLQFLAPNADNVLVHAVYLAVLLGYGETYIVGADASWHQYLNLDQVSNALTIGMEHHYGKCEYTEYQDDEERVLANMAWTTGYIHRAFISFDVVADYARSKGARVYNGSSFSWIDSFPRRSLASLPGGGRGQGDPA